MSYEERRIKVRIRLSDRNAPEQSTFDGSNDTIVIDNCKAVATSSIAPGLSGSSMQLILWGLSLDHIAKIVGPGVGKYQNGIFNNITVWANDEIFYKGVIFTSHLDFSTPSENKLVIFAQSNTAAQFIPTTRTVFSKPISFIEACEVITSKIGMKVKSYISDFTISPIHLKGSVKNQLLSLVNSYRNKKVGVIFTFSGVDLVSYVNNDNDENSLPSIEVSPDNGLIGYPSFTMQGISFQMLYSPDIQPNALVKLTTNLPNASGVWTVQSVTHQISAWVDGGAWFSNVIAFGKTS